MVSHQQKEKHTVFTVSQDLKSQQSFLSNVSPGGTVGKHHRAFIHVCNIV